MIIENLPRTVFDENDGDFSKCEGKWRQEDDIDVTIDLQWVEDSIARTKQIIISTGDLRNLPYLENIEQQGVETVLSEGKVIQDMFLFYREKNDLPKCPLCGSSYTPPIFAVSRRNPDVIICSDCGMKEAFEDLGEYRD